MTFLHPFLLPLLALAGVPLLLHLLTRNRFRTVELSTFRFLFAGYVQQRRRIKLVEALLAALRVAFLLFIGLALARPVLEHWTNLVPGSSGTEVVMLVDCSASMAARTSGVTALDRAKAAAEAIAARLSPDDHLTLVRVGARTEELSGRDDLAGLEVSAGRADWLTALRQVKADRPLVYVFTDGQAAGWREIITANHDSVMPTGSRLVVVDVGDREPRSNVAVVGDAPPRQRAVVGLPIVLQARVVNHSPTPVDVVLTTVIDDKEVARTPLMVEPGKQATSRTIHVPETAASHRCRFEVRGAAGGAFPEDDSYLFTLAVAPRVRVLVVNGGVTAGRDDSLYVRTALTVASSPGRFVPGELGSESLEVAEVAEADVTSERLATTDVVILANCGSLQSGQYQLLRSFVSGGGGLLIFPGDRVNPAVYNQHFFAPPGVTSGRLLAVDLAGTEGDPEKADTFERLASLDFAHPALGVFDDPESRFFRSVRVYRRFGLQAPTTGDATRFLARFSSGAPALVEDSFGDGVVVLSAFPAHPGWTNLPLKQEFVPLLLRLTGHVLRRPVLECPAVVAAGSRAEVRTRTRPDVKHVTFTDPLGRSRQVVVERVDQTEARGYHSVELRGASEGKAEFAVNVDPHESDLTHLNAEALRAGLPNVRVDVVDASAGAQAHRGSIGSRSEVGSWLVAGLIAVLVLELFLATPPAGKGANNRRKSPGNFLDSTRGPE